MKLLVTLSVIIVFGNIALSQTKQVIVKQSYTEYYIRADSVVIKNSKNIAIENFKVKQYPVKIYESCFHPDIYTIYFFKKNKLVKKLILNKNIYD